MKYLEYYIWEQLSITFKLCEWMMKLLWWFWHVITYSDMFVTPEESMEKSTEADSTSKDWLEVLRKSLKKHINTSCNSPWQHRGHDVCQGFWTAIPFMTLWGPQCSCFVFHMCVGFIVSLSSPVPCLLPFISHLIFRVFAESWNWHPTVRLSKLLWESLPLMLTAVLSPFVSRFWDILSWHC